MKKSIQMLLMATLALTSGLIKTMEPNMEPLPQTELPVYIKNETNYDLQIIFNGMTAWQIQLAPNQLIQLHQTNLNDLNRLQIKNTSGYITTTADIKKDVLNQKKQGFFRHLENATLGYVPCVFIKSQTTGWYITTGWTKP